MLQLQVEGLLDTARADAVLQCLQRSQRSRVFGVLVEPVVGCIARSLLRGRTLGQAAQVLDQHHAQRRRQCPQLGQRKRALGLVCAQVTVQQSGIEAAVGVRHPSPGHAVDARQAGQWLVAQARQQAEEAARQAFVDGLQLFLDQGGVVEQPVRGRAQMAALGHPLLQLRARTAQHLDIALQARKELRARARAGYDLVRLRQAVAMLFEARGPEQHRTHRRLQWSGAGIEQGIRAG